MSRTAAGIQYNARSMNGIISINADEITCSGTITSDLIKATNLLEGDTAETISGLWNFTTLPYSTTSATTANQFTNKTYVDGAISSSLSGYVSIAGTESISGVKTFTNGLKISANKYLYLGTGATGGLLTFSLSNTFFDNTAGGSHFFQNNSVSTLSIDTTGLNLFSGKNLYFNNSSIINNGTNSRLDINTNTGWVHSLRINNVEQLGLDATLGATFLNSIRMKLGSRFYPDDTFLGGAISGDAGGGFRFDADVGASYNFYCDSTPAFTIQGTGVIVPTNQIAQFGVTGSSIGYSAGTTQLQYKTPISKTHNFYVNAIQKMAIDASGVVLGDTLYLDSTKVPYIKSNGFGGVSINNDVANSTSFLFGGTTQHTINASGYTAYPDNCGVVLGLTNGATTCRIQQDTATTCLRYSVPSGYLHRWRTTGSTTRMDLIDTGLKVYQGYYIKQGSGTTIFGASVFNNYWTGVVYQAWIDGTNIGSYTLSDYRIKEEIVKARPVLDRLCQIDMIEYEFKNISIFKKHGRHHGFYAHQVQQLFPELDNIVSGEKDALNETGEIQPQTICAEFGNLYLTAIQELNAKIEAQQKVIEDQQRQIDQLLILFSQSRV